MSAFPENHSHDAEFLLDQFYQWEMRGRGWAKWDAPVELEPPFRPFEGHSLPVRRYRDDGIQETRLSRFAARFLGLGTPKQETPEPAQIEIEEPPPEYLGKREELVELHVSLPSDYEASHDVFEQCLFGLGYCRGALAFEVIGASDGIVAQLVCERGDEEAVRTQFKSHFPEAVIEPIAGHLLGRWSEHETKSAEILEFGLEREFMLSLNSSCDLAIDPLVAVCGALEKLRAGEAGVFQVLFQPVRDAWSESIWRAVTTEDGGSFFDGAPEFVKQTGQKLARPLFSAVVRVAAKSPSAERTLQIIRGLAGALKLFANSTGNALVPLENDGYPDDAHEADLLGRVSRRSGMLLNSDELVSLAHLPTAAVRSRKLKRATKRSKEPPLIAIGEGIVLGENVHEGRVMPITLKPYQRVRHMHVVGATGTGKSTLLLNLIGQDIAAGQGVGVIDPHGDLIDQVLCRVPPERFDDVIIFDASDEDYPIGFNVLSAHSSLERNLLASDLVAVFRRLSTSWGDQMNSVLANAILAFLESSNGGTVADLRRFLLEPAFRTQFLGTVEDREVRYYWERAFPTLKTNSVGPLLTRLDTFLRPKAIRYMVSQQANKLDFAAILNQGKIFLAKLSEGFVGEENAFLLGTLLVAKFHQLAISRQEMEESERRPFYLYLDEFHHFATPSMAKILSGVRKYQLGLVLAHHGAAQLQWSPELASAVLSHPYTRVCFRVGDEDARKLADGFSFFETRDFQNLDIGEAICRMERADFDFNVRIPLPPPVDRAEAARIRAELVTRSRQKYATPRQEVEDALAKDWEESEPKRRKPSEDRRPPEPGHGLARSGPKSPGPQSPPVSPMEPPTTIQSPVTTSESIAAPPPLPADVPKTPRPATAKSAMPAAEGIGGAQHQSIQLRIVTAAKGWRYHAEKEKEILNKEGLVDVWIETPRGVIACEIGITTTIDHEVGNIIKCFDAGARRVAAIGVNADKLQKLKQAVTQTLASERASRVGFYLVNDFLDYLQRIGAEDARPLQTEGKVGKYKVKSSFAQLSEEERQRRLENAHRNFVEGAKKTGRSKK